PALELSPEACESWSAAQASDPRFDSPFLSPHWARAVAQAQGPASGVRVAIQRDAAGGAAAFLAVRQRGATAMPPGAPMCDYQAVVARQDVTADPRAMLRAMGVSRYDFCHMQADDPGFRGHGRGQ